jgi:hypothetical protein
MLRTLAPADRTRDDQVLRPRLLRLADLPDAQPKELRPCSSPLGTGTMLSSNYQPTLQRIHAPCR